jgi:hypothetical protein
MTTRIATSEQAADIYKCAFNALNLISSYQPDGMGTTLSLMIAMFATHQQPDNPLKIVHKIYENAKMDILLWAKGEKGEN